MNFSEIFQSLENMELALLLKNIPTNIIDSNYHFIENEKEWHNKLNCYLNKIDLYKRKNIIELFEKINLD